MKHAEAIPGNRVIIRDNGGYSELKDATGTVIDPKEHGARFTFPASSSEQIGIALDEPFASNWGRRDIYYAARNLAHAPSYTDLVRELAETRTVKDNLTGENAKLAKQLETVRTDRNLQRKLAESRLETIVAEQDENSNLLNELFAANQRLAGQPLAQWERDLLGLPDLRKFVYAVPSTTTPGKTYFISVLNGEIIDCTCPGWHFRGYCKHSDHFIIPAEAWEDARRYRARKDTAKRQDILQQIAALVKDYQS